MDEFNMHDDTDEDGVDYADIFSQAGIEFDLEDDEYVTDMLVVYKTTTINDESAEDGMERTRVAVNEGSSYIMGLGLAHVAMRLIEEHGL